MIMKNDKEQEKEQLEFISKLIKQAKTEKVSVDDVLNMLTEKFEEQK